VPKTANGPEGTVDFESVEVEEHFTIYLHNETTGQNIKQWRVVLRLQSGFTATAG
jgi:hypothetical protein